MHRARPGLFRETMPDHALDPLISGFTSSDLHISVTTLMCLLA